MMRSSGPLNPRPGLGPAGIEQLTSSHLHTLLFLEGIAMFGVIGWIIFGLIVGIVAKLLMPGRDPGGIIITMALGIAGALLGGFLGRTLGWYGENEPAGFLMSLVDAVLLLWIYRMMVGRRQRI